MKTLRTLGIVAVSLVGAALLSGCAVEFRPPFSVYSGPVAVEPAGADWWYDGSTYYYYDSGAGAYFYYGPDAEVIWMSAGWAPLHGWYHIGRPGHFPIYRGGHPVRGGWGGHGGRPRR
ncbi:MAG TPA: hypothetical protein V6C81_18345 [Planktothrix sp.]|jgi:hypothetical protein